MGGGNQTSVATLTAAGGAVVLGFWILGYFAPAFMAAAPVGVESAATIVLTAVISYWSPVIGKKE